MSIKHEGSQPSVDLGGGKKFIVKEGGELEPGWYYISGDRDKLIELARRLYIGLSGSDPTDRDMDILTGGRAIRPGAAQEFWIRISIGGTLEVGNKNMVSDAKKNKILKDVVDAEIR